MLTAEVPPPDKGAYANPISRESGSVTGFIVAKPDRSLFSLQMIAYMHALESQVGWFAFAANRASSVLSSYQ